MDRLPANHTAVMQRNYVGKNANSLVDVGVIPNTGHDAKVCATLETKVCVLKAFYVRTLLTAIRQSTRLVQTTTWDVVVMDDICIFDDQSMRRSKSRLFRPCQG
jgi:hypothetical protein